MENKGYSKIEVLKRKILNKILGYIPLKTTTKYKNGNVLLSYDINPFFTKKSKGFSATHSNQWECAEIANLFLKKGYDVDVIKWDNYQFQPKTLWALRCYSL